MGSSPLQRWPGGFPAPSPAALREAPPKNKLYMSNLPISHLVETPASVRGLTEQDFIRVANNGFGDPYNAYPHSMVWFKDHLYVGTTRANMAYVGKQRQVKNPVESLEIWPVRIPEGLFDIDLRAEIWRYDPRRHEWTRLLVSPLVTGKDGFVVPLSIGFRTMGIYQGKSDPAPAIFAPTWGSHQTPYTVLSRCIDGEHFEFISQKGMGLPDPKPRALRGFIPFKNKLFMSPGMGQIRREPNVAGFMVVMVSEDPSRDKWDIACKHHFGNPNNLTAFQLTVFNDHLYAGTLNVNEGFEIWKTRAEGSPPYEWTPVLRRGAYRGKLNQVAMTFREFNGYLYVGTAIQGGGYDVVNQVGPAAPEIIRIAPDNSWDLIVGEPRLTPDGLKVPLSDLGPGYNNVFAGYHWAMEVHEGWLYSGNAVWTLFTRYLKDGDHIPPSVRKTIGYMDRDAMLNRFGGCQLWRTRDGHRWYPVTLSGFNNYYNMGIRTMKSTPYGLFVGTTNPFGPDIAVKRIAGWNYEHNPNGGLEIWLGARKEVAEETVGEEEPPVLAEIFRRMGTPAGEETRKETEEQDNADGLLSMIYQPGGFRHPGYWIKEVETPHEACENLIGELLSLTQHNDGTVVDIGCGLGATTQHLAKFIPPKSIIGICEDENRLAVCRERIPGIKFVSRKLPKLRLTPDSVACAFWAKGEADLGPRDRLLSETFRILKPGGELAFFDFLCASTAGRSDIGPLWSCERTFYSLEECRSWLERVGFVDVVLYDVTQQTLGGTKRYLERYFRNRLLAGVIPREAVEALRARLAAAAVKIDKCLICYAVKPE